MLASIICGFLYGRVYSSNQVINSNFPELDFIKNLPPILLFLIIFLNNSIKALLAIYLGVIFGLFPLYFMAANGFIIGIFLDSVAKNEGIKYFLAGIIPHGILELSAIILASAYGLWLGWLYFKKWIRKEKVDTKTALRFCWQKYYTIILPVLLAAAILEAYLTPIVIKHFS